MLSVRNLFALVVAIFVVFICIGVVFSTMHSQPAAGSTYYDQCHLNAAGTQEICVGADGTRR